MSEHPVLFSAPMIRALLDGRKTMTRRVINPRPIKPELWAGTWVDAHREQFARSDAGECAIVKIAAGDRLWVREAFSYDRLDIDKDGTLPPWYWAAGNPEGGDWTKPKSSIHMPRWASRLTLEVTGVTIERLQDISEEDARAEGIVIGEPLPELPDSPGDIYWSGIGDGGHPCSWSRSAIAAFAELWDSLNAGRMDGAASWGCNPWIYALTFRVIKANIDSASKKA